jgi:glutathione synthase/RimK-type ligase-like ATP-grasp enzyme
MQKIAIHHRPESYSVEWIKYCELNNIPFKIVNCFDSDIISQLDDCKGLMWHWPQWDYKAILFARQLTYALESSGIKVFPNSNTCWHYDDKVGQKYLLEANDIPFVPTTIFYDKSEALKWCEKASFPKVFKLAGGASSMNVKLVCNKAEAKQFVIKAFKTGFPIVDRGSLLHDRFLDVRKELNLKSLVSLVKGFGRVFVPTKLEKTIGNDIGYIYFQDFIPDNTFDIRVYVIGNRAFGVKRLVRANDFRASGSHNLIFDPNQIDLKCVSISFEVAHKLNLQSVAFDFVFSDSQPLITEISYASAIEGYRKCPGYWDNHLAWHNEQPFEEFFMIEDFIHSLNEGALFYQI